MPIKLRKKAAGNSNAPSSGATSKPSGPVELLSVGQAAEYLKVAEITIRRWLKAQIIPSFKVGKQIRIDRAELIRFLNQQ